MTLENYSDNLKRFEASDLCAKPKFSQILELQKLTGTLAILKSLFEDIEMSFCDHCTECFIII